MLRILVPCLLFLALAAVTGCGLTKAQKEGIGAFGRGAATLGTASSEQFRNGRERVIEMKRQQLAIEKMVLPPRKPDGTAADRKYYAEELNLDSGLDPANIEKRVAAAELLVRYGNLLVAFSEETQEKELTSAAAKFAGGVKNFPNSPLTAAEADGLGRLVVATGKIWVEQEKREALKRIVPTVSPLIARLCSELEKDFDPAKRGVAGAIYTAQGRLSSEAIDGLKREGGSLTDRLLLIDAFALADRNRNEIGDAAEKLSKTVAAMRQADKKLVQLLEDDALSLEEIRTFADNVEELAKAVKPFTK